jgi:hypothetical protein
VPEVASMVPTEVLLLLQVPPEVVLLQVLVVPTHKPEGPDKVPASGVGFTVIATLSRSVQPKALSMK